MVMVFAIAVGMIALGFTFDDPKDTTPEAPLTGEDLFRERVWPILKGNCFACHGEDPNKIRGGLILTNREAFLAGGEQGAAFDFEHPGHSLLLEMISYKDEHHEMPPIGKLPDVDIKALTRWINEGAPWPEDPEFNLGGAIEQREFVITDEDRNWWSYRPLERPEAPAVRDSTWVRNPIDTFILARLESAGLTPAREADRLTLVRRVYYDLIGLPPTPEQVEAFLTDERPDAYERLIDRLLDSPQYGVKWGRHWLDLVRWGETNSYERDSIKPNAWKYRDYVINAFNADMPYDQFVIEQLAGDEVDQPTLNTMIATGYTRLGIWDDEPTDVLLAQYDDLNDVVDTTARVMLGVSLGCARCHDHKRDPVAQDDFYRFLAFFENVSPYKAQAGNSLTPANFIKQVPVDPQGYEQALAEYHEQRRRVGAEIESFGHQVLDNLSPGDAIQSLDWMSDGLAAHLPLDDAPGAAEARDIAGDWNAEVLGAHAEAEGRHGTAFSFNGGDQYLRVKRPVQDDFTISLWFRTDMLGSGGNERAWFRGSGLVDGEDFGVINDFGVAMLGNGHVIAGVGNPDTHIMSPPGNNDGQWHHVAFTRHRETGEISLWVDGANVGTATGNTERLDATAYLDIGRIQTGYNYFHGSIDDVRFYDRVLSDRDISGLAHGFAYGPTFTSLASEVLGEDEATAHDARVTEYLAMRPPSMQTEPVLCIQERGAVAPETYVHIRGNPHARGRDVEPGFPLILDPTTPDLPTPSEDATSTGRRRVLAEWIVRDDNPRTSRVIANRIWQYHFGRGIVPTPNDFGRLGLKPTHPDLLDWLAVEFVERDWRFKDMHRLVMTSAAYRMTSEGDDAALASDPENLLFWRFNMRRLSAEEIRDSILAANGTLNLKMGGAGVYPEMPAEVLATSSRPGEAWGKSSPEEAARRSVYIHVKRSLIHPMLSNFDLADTDASCPVRFITTQPTQALGMLNGKFINDQASILADRLLREVPDDRNEQVALAIQLTTSRDATDSEVRDGVVLIESLQSEHGLSDREALDMFCLMALNLNEFVYLD